MLETTLDLLRCPACATEAPLAVVDADWVTVQYSGAPRRELRSGRLQCGECGSSYPVSDFVPSFAERLPRDVRSDADYWGRYYAGEAAKGNRTFLEPDLARRGRSGNAYDPERFLLDHPLLRQRGRCADLGCGTGWTTLMLARAGFAAVGVEPSVAALVEAKRYAMDQETPVDYVCGAPGHLRFAAGVLDQVFAFHSLHHVPDLMQTMPEIVSWMREGGVLAVDEHVQSQPQYWSLSQLTAKYLGWSQDSPPSMSEPSANEDCSRAAVLPSIASHFRVADARFRQVAFDGLAQWAGGSDGDEEAVRRLSRALSRALYEWHPGEAEYATVLAVKGRGAPTAEDLHALHTVVPAAILPLFGVGRAGQGRGANSWPGRLRRGWRLLASGGPKPFLREVAQYLSWRLSA